MRIKNNKVHFNKNEMRIIKAIAREIDSHDVLDFGSRRMESPKNIAKILFCMSKGLSAIMSNRLIYGRQ